MRATEVRAFQNVDATPSAFFLSGGKYGVAVTGTWNTTGTVKLQMRGPDGSTFMSVSSGTDFSDDGFVTVDLPPGLYQLAIDTATAVYASVARIPGE